MKISPYRFKMRHTYKLRKTNEQNKEFSNSSIVTPILSRKLHQNNHCNFNITTA